MFNLLHVEYIKFFSRKRFLVLSLLSIPVILFVAYSLAYGFEFKAEASYSLTNLSMWSAIINLFHFISGLIWMTLSVGCLILWQQQEHYNNTFKLYAILPINTFSSLFIRFNLFFLISTIMYVISFFGGIKLIEIIWMSRFPNYNYIGLSETIITFVQEIAKAQIFFSYLSFFLIYVITLISNKISYPILLLIIFITLNLLSVPDWFALAPQKQVFRYLNLIYVRGVTSYRGSLIFIYVANFVTSLSLVGISFFLISKNRFFFLND
jgi:hypothetical protein